MDHFGPTGSSKRPRIDEGMSPRMADLFRTVSNLALAHEIALDESFDLTCLQKPGNSLYGQVKSALHNAFWDKFREEISQDPPVLDQAFSLLQEIKRNLFDVMLPHNETLKNEADKAIDLELLRQQAEHDAVDVRATAAYILSVMEKVCAPVRDNHINKLKSVTNTADLFRGILELLHLMKTDLLNYAITCIRPKLQKNGFHEREAFDKFMRWQGTHQLPQTRKWLFPRYKEYFDPENVYESVRDAVCHAFAELFDVRLHRDYVPEVVLMDYNRVNDFYGEFHRLLICYSTLLSIFNSTISGVMLTRSFQEVMKRHVYVMSENVTSDEAFEKFRTDLMPLVLTDTQSARELAGFRPMNQTEIVELENGVASVSSPDNDIRKIIRRRLIHYIYKALRTGDVNDVPCALLLYKTELASFTTGYKEMVYHNLSLYMDYFVKIFVKGDRPWSPVDFSNKDVHLYEEELDEDDEIGDDDC